MLPRWNSVVNNIKVFLKTVTKLLKKVMIRKNKRGRPPKHPISKYLQLLITKESKRASLRDAENDYSDVICEERVDHSVIHYWEKKIDKHLFESITSIIGKYLEDRLGYDFSFIDSTLFTSWDKNEIEFYTMLRIAKDTLYPVGLFFDQSKTPSIAVDGCIVEGDKELLADAWYDDNKSFGIMFRAGYDPIVKPNKERFRGYYRHKARKLFMNPTGMQKYRQRGRGESMYGSLTNAYGDRLKTSRYDTSITRIGCRVIAYSVRIMIRCDYSELTVIIWMNY